MDLSIFLILISATFQFISEYFNWNQTKVKLIIFLFILIITLPNIMFMVIDWWQSPHSKITLLVLNTFQPILRGETYRLFRWLKSFGINLACDDLNHLPITKLGLDSTEIYVTRECHQIMEAHNIRGIWDIIDEVLKVRDVDKIYVGYTKCTFFWAYYRNGVFDVHLLKNSTEVKDLCFRLQNDVKLLRHPLFKSNLMKSASYSVDSSRAQLLFTRLMTIFRKEMPILTKFVQKREWHYFHAGSTLDHLNGDLVLIQPQGQNIAVGSPRYNMDNGLWATLNRRWNASSSGTAKQRW